MSKVDRLERALKEALEGEVRFDSVTRTIYSVDASIHELEPMGVVLPRHTEDLQKLIAIAAEENVPLTPRGAGTGIVGSALGKGLIVDTSYAMNKIVKIDPEKKLAVCEPGVIQNELNNAAAVYGLRLGPNTSTGNRATLGGMIGTNAGGSHSLKYGQTVDHVVELKLAVSSGEVLTLSPVDKDSWQTKTLLPGTEGAIFRTLEHIRSTYGHEIERNFPKLPRQVSGYNLDRLLRHGPYNPCSMVVGAEGTLGIVTQATFSLCTKPKGEALLLLSFATLAAAFEAVMPLLALKPDALELIDDKIIGLGKRSPSMRGKLSFLEKAGAHLLVVAFDGDTQAQAEEHCRAAAASADGQAIGLSQQLIMTPQEIENVWSLRKAGLGILLSKRSYSRAISFIEDVAVPPERLGAFMSRLSALLASHGKEAGIYGHVGAGAMHIRPWINARDPAEFRVMQQIFLEVSDLLLEFKGSFSAEHGDGLCRSWLNRKMFGPLLYEAFKEVKYAFDPKNLMNPGKIISDEDWRTHLRASPQVPTREIDTFLDFSKEGGFSLSADLCNGNGTCRKREGLMCPSFQATEDEYETTRARAQSFRAIVTGRRPMSSFTSEEMHGVLDHCILCKGCKTECPSQVDMAKMKSEFLYQYGKVHGFSIRDRLFGNIARLNKISSPFGGLLNRLMGKEWFKRLSKRMGLSTEHELPRFAPERFSKIWKKQNRKRSEQGDVVLYIDTFTEYNHPEIGIAAASVMEALGAHVIIPRQSCCGRPALSKGLLPLAKKQAEHALKILEPYVEKGLSIVGLEPSCILTIKDDFPSLSKRAEAVSAACLTFDEWVAREVGKCSKRELERIFPGEKKEVAVHLHCHHKSLRGAEATKQLMKKLEIPAKILATGCCGMAGSFGYEAEHSAFSKKIAESTLLPYVEALEEGSILLANGTSCRTQLKSIGKRKSQHLAEYLAGLLISG